MQLNHLNLTVTDPPAVAGFLVRYCGMRLVDDKNKNFIFLSDGNDIVLALMKGKDVRYPENFHIGFIQDSREKVDLINARLRDDGYDVDPPKELHAWTFYVKLPGAFTIEILA